MCGERVTGTSGLSFGTGPAIPDNHPQEREWELLMAFRQLAHQTKTRAAFRMFIEKLKAGSFVLLQIV